MSCRKVDKKKRLPQENTVTRFILDAFDLANVDDPNVTTVGQSSATAGTTAALIQQINTPIVIQTNKPQRPMNFMSQFIAFACSNLNSKFVFFS